MLSTLWRGDRERGGGGPSLSAVLLTPILFGLVFTGVAFGFRMFGENLALGAADAGARAAAVLPASADRGRQAALDFLAEKASGTVSDYTVTVTIDGDTVNVTVTGKTPLLPGELSRQSSLVLEPEQP